MDRVIVISGASQGLGKCLAEQFVKEGDTVIGLSRSTLKDANWHQIPCDITNNDSINAAIEKIKAEFSHIDILINNAGVGLSGASELLPFDKVEDVMAVNYFGSLSLTRMILPLMGTKGRIIFVSSACALFALPFRSVYCSAKAAVNMLSFSLRMELKNTNIKVVCVCPGDVKTTFTSNRIKSFETNERYSNLVENAYNKVDKNHNHRMDPQKVTRKLFKIATFKNKPLYIIGTKYKFLYFFSRILPTRLFLALTAKMFAPNNPKK